MTSCVPLIVYFQFVRSGRVAITTSCFERVNEYLADRETKYRLKKEKEQNNE